MYTIYRAGELNYNQLPSAVLIISLERHIVNCVVLNRLIRVNQNPLLAFACIFRTFANKYIPARSTLQRIND